MVIVVAVKLGRITSQHSIN